MNKKCIGVILFSLSAGSMLGMDLENRSPIDFVIKIYDPNNKSLAEHPFVTQCISFASGDTAMSLERKSFKEEGVQQGSIFTLRDHPTSFSHLNRSNWSTTPEFYMKVSEQKILQISCDVVPTHNFSQLRASYNLCFWRNSRSYENNYFNVREKTDLEIPRRNYDGHTSILADYRLQLCITIFANALLWTKGEGFYLNFEHVKQSVKLVPNEMTEDTLGEK